MKKKLAIILTLALLVSLLVPVAASAAAGDTYKVTITMTGPAQGEGTPPSITKTYSYMKGTLKSLFGQFTAESYAEAQDVFDGSGYLDDFDKLYKAAKGDDEEAWAEAVDTYFICETEGVAGLVKDWDSQIYQLADIAKSFTAEWSGYTLTVTLAIDTVYDDPDPTPSDNTSSSAEPTTETTTNPDGSVTETTTETKTTENPDGTTTETTNETATTTADDGSVTETKTEATETLDANGNGTVESTSTETVKDENGNVTQITETESKGTVETDAEGTKTTTTTSTAKTTDAAGNTTTTVTEEKAIEQADGSTGKVVSDTAGNTLSAEAAVSEEAVTAAAANDDVITLAVEVKAADDTATAAEIDITLPELEEAVKVEIPVENLKPGTVAVIVKEDGSKEILKTSTNSENGVVVTLDGSATIQIVDNTKTFDDVDEDKWYANDVAWAASREVMIGTENGFEPELETSRGMVTQLLFNLESAQGGETTAAFSDVSEDDWYAASVTWAEENGIAQGQGETFGADDTATREQVAVMLYNYATLKGYDTSVSGDMSAFTDAGDVSDYAEAAMRWAVGIGLMNGMGDGTVNPQGNATRAQIAALMQRFCDKVAK